VRLALTTLLLAAGCGSASGTAPETTPLDADLMALHDDAIYAFQRALYHEGAFARLDCDTLCRAADQACQTAVALCTSSAAPAAASAAADCTRARQGCGWTVTLMPRACRACAPPPDAAATPLEEPSP